MKEIKKIYLMHFLSGFSNVATVTFTLYLLSHGVNQTQIGFLFGFFMISMAVFNIPTGVIADIFGHKLSVVTALLLQALTFLIFFLYPNYLGFLVGMFTYALGNAFQSGAISSLTYELLHKEGLHESFQKITGKSAGYLLIGAMIASPIGSFIYKFYPSIPYFFASIFFIFAALVTFLIKWEFVKKPQTISNYLNILTEGVRLTIKNRILMATVIIGIALSVNRLVFNQNISQPYMQNIGLDVVFFGFVAAVVSGVQALVSIYAYKLSEKFGVNISLLFIIAIPSLSVIALSFINNLLAISLIIVLFIGHGLRDPIISHITQQEVESDKRSTMASTTSFLISIIVGLLLPFWGKAVDLFDLNNGLFFLGIFSFLVGIFGLAVFGIKRTD